MIGLKVREKNSILYPRTNDLFHIMLPILNKIIYIPGHL